VNNEEFLILVLFFVLSVNNVLTLHLVFKTQKEIRANDIDSVEIAIVDVSRFKKIRIGAYLVSDLKDTGNVIRVDGIEGEDLFMINTILINSMEFGRTERFETLPNRIRISTMHSGTYRIYIWAQ
jgi:hypothetical protein